MQILDAATKSMIRANAKYLKTTPIVTNKGGGLVTTKNLLTGTTVAKFDDGVKTIILGKGNNLSKLVGEGSVIIKYPVNLAYGKQESLISLCVKGSTKFMEFTQQEFGNFVKILKNSVK